MIIIHMNWFSPGCLQDQQWNQNQLVPKHLSVDKTRACRNRNPARDGSNFARLRWSMVHHVKLPSERPSEGTKKILAKHPILTGYVWHNMILRNHPPKHRPRRFVSSWMVIPTSAKKKVTLRSDLARHLPCVFHHCVQVSDRMVVFFFNTQLKHVGFVFPGSCGCSGNPSKHKWTSKTQSKLVDSWDSWKRFCFRIGKVPESSNPFEHIRSWWPW